MPESIGQRLKQTREARYLTLERASEDTRIRVLFLQALEADDYSVIPSAAQGRGFLRNYAEYLDLNIDEMIAEIQRNAPAPAEVSGPLPQVNLLETEIPPLVNEDENPAPRFFNRWLGRRPKAVSTAETESPLQAHAQDTAEPVLEEIPVPVEVETTEAIVEPKTRGRKKKKVEEEILPQAAEIELKPAEETLPVEPEQLPVKEEAKASFVSQLVESIQSLFKKKEPKSAPVVEVVEVESAPEEVKPVVPTLLADVIFAEIGVQLRERRELISLTLDEVERHTHLRAVFLKALEDGAMDKLPSPVQTRGMLANYATFLDLDTDTILLRFADVLQARRHEKYAETPRENIQTEVVTSMPFLRTFIAGDLIFGVVMIAILAALAIWGFGRLVSSTNEQDVEPTAPSIVDVLGDVPLPTASLQSTFVAVNDDPLATSPAGVDVLISPEAPTEGVAANVTVSIFSLERVFVKISVDGEVAFEGRMAPRETKVFNAENQVVVLTGNASALRVTYNGQDLGLMGGIGEVVSRVYLISGVVTPTATIPPTPTETPLVTPTGTPTSTPTATPTGTPPDGG
jgi:cytoskeletal protein RodZ